MSTDEECGVKLTMMILRLAVNIRRGRVLFPDREQGEISRERGDEWVGRGMKVDVERRPLPSLFNAQLPNLDHLVS